MVLSILIPESFSCILCQSPCFLSLQHRLTLPPTRSSVPHDSVLKGLDGQFIGHLLPLIQISSVYSPEDETGLQVCDPCPTVIINGLRARWQRA